MYSSDVPRRFRRLVPLRFGAGAQDVVSLDGGGPSGSRLLKARPDSDEDEEEEEGDDDDDSSVADIDEQDWLERCCLQPTTAMRVPGVDGGLHFRSSDDEDGRGEGGGKGWAANKRRRRRGKKRRRRKEGGGDEEEAKNSASWCCSPVALRCLLVALLMLLFYLILVAAGGGTGSGASYADQRTGGGVLPIKPEDAFDGHRAPTDSANLTRARLVLSTLCADWKQDRIEGDECARLCGTVAPNASIAFFSETANKTVIGLRAGASQTTSIWKSARPFFNDMLPMLRFAADVVNLDNDDQSNDEEADAFERHVLATVNSQLLGLGWPDVYVAHLLDRLWPKRARDLSENGGRLSPAARRSLAALLAQPEYVTFRIMPLSRVTPRVIGTCGHFYHIETMVPFRMRGYYSNLKSKILIHLMGTLKLFHEFLNQPLQWCGVDFERLALSAEYPKRFMVMDANELYTTAALGAKFESLDCTKDEDCRVGDCTARCLASGKCSSKRWNDNVDVFCEKLINPMFSSSWSKSNKYLAACHDTSGNRTERLKALQLSWTWSLSDV